MVEKKWKGNFTVEAAILASALLFIVYGIIMALFLSLIHISEPTRP